MINKRWVPSRFNVVTKTDNEELLIYNSYTGAIAAFSVTEKQEVLSLLKRKGVESLSQLGTILEAEGFLVSSEIDEKQRAQFLHQSLHRTDMMHLIIMPTEACNFRCTYCYESFPRGNMSGEVLAGLKKFVETKAGQLSNLMVSWFGGEPLLALDEITSLSKSFLETARNHQVDYKAEMATNGYYLTEDTCRKLLALEVRQFMVTIDGSEVIHDQRRKLVNGKGTFKTIIHNLKQLKNIDDQFEVFIRINFDESNLNNIPSFIASLSEFFQGDKRFQVFCRPVGRWGGENDENIPVCDRQTSDIKIWEFTEHSLSNGLAMSSQIESALMPTGSVCYAAKPHSLVVGSNGQLYKCTLAFDQEFNQVGQLAGDGTATLNFDKIAAWTLSGEEKDEHCQSCFYRPACQGNHCPLYRIQTGKRPCPFEKRQIKKVLQLLWKSYDNP
ncbi:radical SAM protein [Anaerobacillus sp. MEB173]|uniref:radical SAM protein n=1 Tax=Anaerobacillus sp. MEB173 TaxID=3383345 RepID=UPI003F922C0A